MSASSWYGMNLTKLPLRLSYWHGPIESHHISISALHKSTSIRPTLLRDLSTPTETAREGTEADSTEVYHCLFFTVTVHLSDTTTWLEHNDNTTGMAHGTTI